MTATGIYSWTVSWPCVTTCLWSVTPGRDWSIVIGHDLHSLHCHARSCPVTHGHDHVALLPPPSRSHLVSRWLFDVCAGQKLLQTYSGSMPPTSWKGSSILSIRVFCPKYVWCSDVDAAYYFARRLFLRTLARCCVIITSIRTPVSFGESNIEVFASVSDHPAALSLYINHNTT